MSNRSLQQRARRRAYAHIVWLLAQIECDVAFMKWRTAGSQGAALAHGEAADDFDGRILTAVDELVEKTQMSDETWAALGERWDKRQLMDFVFTVGGYHMLAMALNTFGVEPKNVEPKNVEPKNAEPDNAEPEKEN